jgi:hypothetical protein
MSPEVLAKLFTPFFQGDATSTRAFEGTGIGLALVKTIVNRHDGDISVESSKGKGTTMTVTLPRSPLDPTELMGMEPATPDAGQLRRPRVLRALAEDPRRRRPAKRDACLAAVGITRRGPRRAAPAPTPPAA